MSLLRSIFGLPERREFSLARWESWLDSGGGVMSNAGEAVNMSTAMTLTGVACAVRIISENVGSLPLDLFRARKNGGYDLAKDDELYAVLRNPNPEQTKMGFFETQSIHGAVRGNAFALIDRYNSSGRTKGIWHVDSDRVEVYRKNGQLLYKVMSEDGRGQPDTYTQDEIMHFSLFSANGVTGMSPLGFARHTFGLSLAQEKYASLLFANGAMPRGVIYHDKPEVTIDANELEDAKKVWKEAYSGTGNSHKTPFLPGGLRYQQLSLTPEDSQFLQSRRFQLAEIARIFHVPLHMLQELEHATFSNIEHQQLEFVIYTIRPWLVRWEETMSRDLLTERQRREGYTIKWNHEALLRGDTKTQAEAFNMYLLNGTLNHDEVREKLNRNPIKDGDKHMIPLNMGILGAPPPDQKPKPSERDQELVKALRDLAAKMNVPLAPEPLPAAEMRMELNLLALSDVFEYTLKRHVNKEVTALKKNVRKLKAAEFESWLTEFYRSWQEDYSEEMARLLVLQAKVFREVPAELEQEITARVQEQAGVYADGALADIRALVSGEWSKFVADVEALAEGWRSTKAKEWADRHVDELLKKVRE